MDRTHCVLACRGCSSTLMTPTPHFDVPLTDCLENLCDMTLLFTLDFLASKLNSKVLRGLALFNAQRLHQLRHHLTWLLLCKTCCLLDGVFLMVSQSVTVTERSDSHIFAFVPNLRNFTHRNPQNSLSWIPFRSWLWLCLLLLMSTPMGFQLHHSNRNHISLLFLPSRCDQQSHFHRFDRITVVLLCVIASSCNTHPPDNLLFDKTSGSKSPFQCLGLNTCCWRW